uniref:Uncharacterized protein n=1 Tax=Arundo donax TaxID=35708 RepID=A0A0A9CWX7_ARUDO
MRMLPMKISAWLYKMQLVLEVLYLYLKCHLKSLYAGRSADCLIQVFSVHSSYMMN